jgi:uncharacterized glyoxalase superfamily protein PhnB
MLYTLGIMTLPLLAVRDVDASVAFYVEVLGFQSQFAMPTEDGSTFAMVAWGDKISIGLTRDRGVYQRGKGVVLMLYVPSGSIDDYHSKVIAGGGKPSQIEMEYWGDRTFTVTDPDGFVLMISQTVQVMTASEIVSAQS